MRSAGFVLAAALSLVPGVGGAQSAGQEVEATVTMKNQPTDRAGTHAHGSLVFDNRLSTNMPRMRLQLAYNSQGKNAQASSVRLVP